MEKRFKAIRSMFPERLELIDCLLIFDEDFQEVCQDYEDLLKALDNPGLLEYIADIRLVCKELEEEMLSRLNRFSVIRTVPDKESSFTIS